MCGIAGLFLFFLFVVPVVALVLGLVAASRGRHARGPGDALGRARAGWILGAIGLAGFVAMMVGIGVTGGFDDDQVSVLSLDVGDCVDLGNPDVQVDTIEELPVRDCDEPHDAEVFAVADLALSSEEYPGTETVVAEVQRQCSGPTFEDYVGQDYQSSEIDVFTLYPTADGWDNGDQEYVCLAINVDRTPLEETVEGSGR